MKYLLLLGCIACMAFVQDRINAFNQWKNLTGKWRMHSRNSYIYEEWQQHTAAEMRGRSYRVKGGDTAFLENISLVKKDKELFYVPVTIGQNNEQPVYFKLTSFKDKQFVFENAEHDFPKRITYKMIGDDSLHAWIDGGPLDTAKDHRLDFYFHKAD